MIKKIAITAVVVLVVALAAVLAVAATRPDIFRVERSASIMASPEKIFPLINDFRSFSTWSPYEKLDPTMKRDFSGAASGKGAVYAWESDGKAGVGRMEIVESSPPSRIAIKLDFVEPFATSNIVEFALAPQGDATNLTWAMHGPNPFIAKVMSVFFSMDAMVGADFETGLANLKAIAEK